MSKFVEYNLFCWHHWKTDQENCPQFLDQKTNIKKIKWVVFRQRLTRKGTEMTLWASSAVTRGFTPPLRTASTQWHAQPEPGAGLRTHFQGFSAFVPSITYQMCSCVVQLYLPCYRWGNWSAERLRPFAKVEWRFQSRPVYGQDHSYWRYTKKVPEH